MDMLPGIMFGTGLSAAKDYRQMKEVVKTALENGITSFDTAPSYKTEKLLAKVLGECSSELNLTREDVFIQTKIDAWQCQEGKKAIKEYVIKTLESMQLDFFDSLLIHWPVPEYLEDAWEALVEIKKEKMAKHIGVCNVRKRHLTTFLDYDIKPEIIQIERNPLFTCLDEVDFCIKNGMAIQAYSPLCKMDARIQKSEKLESLSKKYNKSIGQIVLRWHLETGVTPIFTSKNVERIKEYSQLYDFSLTAEEILSVNQLNVNHKLYLESWACPGF